MAIAVGIALLATSKANRQAGDQGIAQGFGLITRRRAGEPRSIHGRFLKRSVRGYGRGVEVPHRRFMLSGAATGSVVGFDYRRHRQMARLFAEREHHDVERSNSMWCAAITSVDSPSQRGVAP